MKFFMHLLFIFIMLTPLTSWADSIWTEFENSLATADKMIAEFNGNVPDDILLSYETEIRRIFFNTRVNYKQQKKIYVEKGDSKQTSLIEEKLVLVNEKEKEYRQAIINLRAPPSDLGAGETNDPKNRLIIRDGAPI